jgi:hypothetical protein
MHEPEGGRAYRMAELVPLERMHEERPPMRRVRSMMHDLLSRPRLGRVEAAKHVVGWFARADVPVHAAIEVAGYALVRDAEMRYRLLAEPDPYRRVAIVRDAVMDLERTIALAERQGSDAWPKGQSWN